LLVPLLLIGCADDPATDVQVDDEPVTSALEQDTGDGIEVVGAADSAEPLPVAFPVLINEICPANRDSLIDLDGESPDWIELLNPQDHPIELTGFGLSDDPDDPFQLVLPTVTLKSDQVLLVRASGNDASDHGNIHAPFKLDAVGETLVLTAPDGRIHDQVETGRLYHDQSLGRDPDDRSWQVYLKPTPLEENWTEGRPGFAETPVLSPDGGFFSTEQTVTVSTSSDTASVHVKLGGDPPTADDAIYTGPISITNGDATVVRAIAYEDGLWPSRVATRTIFLDRPIDLPVWSITSADADLFDTDTGVLSPLNLWDNLEVDTHLEFYEADGSLVLATDAGLKLHGGASRTFPQKGLRLLFRSGYGVAPFEHALFPDHPVNEFHRLILRNGGHDDGQTELRDPLSHVLMKDLDVDVQGYRPTIVFLNGRYWGLYNTREKQDRFYAASHHGVDPDDLDFLEYDGSIVNEGDNEDYQALFDHVVYGDMSDPDQYAAIPDWVDVDEYILYNIIEVFSGNYDWPGNNIQFWRERSDEGRWRWTLYDTESGWYNWITPGYNSIHHATVVGRTWWPYPNWSTSLFRNMLESPEFREQFINTYADLLNTRFLPRNSVPLFDEMVDAISGEIALSQVRWGHSLSRWEIQVIRVRDFLYDRPGHTQQHIVFEFGLPGTWDLSLDVDPPGAGHVALQVVDVTEPFTGTYFLDVPVPLRAVAADGWEFVGWSDERFGPNAGVTVDPDGDLSLVALFEAVP